jgi:hypothetical protein
MERDHKRAIANFIDIVVTEVESRIQEVDDLVLFRLDKRIEEVFKELDDADTDIDSFDVVGFADRCRKLLESCEERYLAILALKEEVSERLDLLKEGMRDTEDMRVFLDKYKEYTYINAPVKKGEKRG